MLYRRLGATGLKVSALSFGSWVTFDEHNGFEAALEAMSAAREAGMNFFDCAEAYAGGDAERFMGRAIAELGWDRNSYVISTKFFFGIDGGINSTNTLNRKYLLHAIDGSLDRLALGTVDLVFCHRPDPETPIEEVVWAMTDIISSGKALYWGVSEWPAKAIRRAYEVAAEKGLRAPVTEQPQYNLLSRKKVEKEFKNLYRDYHLGLTTWSPLAYGVLTGKYLHGIPQDSRAATSSQFDFTALAQNCAIKHAIEKLVPLAEHLDCSLAQLAIAWCLKNPHVSTVITGASRASQVQENLGALHVVDRLDESVLEKIDALFPRNASFEV